MKVIICGSRNFPMANRDFFEKTCKDILVKEQYDKIIPKWEIEIVSGNNPKGVDWLGEQWAKANEIALKLFPADWRNENPKRPENWGSQNRLLMLKQDTYGNYNMLAGYVRNQEMANYSKGGIALAFDTEKTNKKTGTRDMIARAKKSNMKVYHIKCSDMNDVKIKVWNEAN